MGKIVLEIPDEVVGATPIFYLHRSRKLVE
jgi:hypothetical protein